MTNFDLAGSPLASPIPCPGAGPVTGRVRGRITCGLPSRLGGVVLCPVVLITAVMVLGLSAGASATPPNIVLIMADDLGLAELGCTGSAVIETPNIDRLRDRGMLFTEGYSGSTVCAPSRCTLLTGLHTGHSQIRDNGETPNFTGDPGAPGTEEISGWTAPPFPEGWWGGQRGLEPGTETIATALDRAGYATYMAGKWGLGGPKLGSMPTDLGFDGFIGYLCQRNAHNFYPTYLVEDGEKLVLDGNDRGLTGAQYSTDLMIDRSRRFIRDHAGKGPFFLYYATPVPHLALQVPDDSLDQYRGRWEETPYPGGKGYLPNETPRATYAAMVSRFDRNVGLILDELEAAGVADDTIVVVTSDNGSTFGIGGYDMAFFDGTGGRRGHKCNLYEGGIRVPFIVSWPGHVASGSSDATPVANWDLMPTLLSLAGADSKAETDGIDLSPVLLGTGEAPVRDHLYWEYHAGGGLQAVRMGRWKGVRNGVHRDPETPVELYDLGADPNETTDVAADHPEVVARIREILSTEHTPSPVPGWNFGAKPEQADGADAGADIMEIGPGITKKTQFVKDVRVVIDGGTLELSGPADPINGSTIEFTVVGGRLVLTRHTPEEFLRKHGRKMRRPDGEKAVNGRDFTVVGHGDGGCIVRPTSAAG
jgi:arylsulfatase A